VLGNKLFLSGSLLRNACAFVLVLSCAACVTTKPQSAQACFEARGEQFGEVLSCYRQAQMHVPLVYRSISMSKTDGLEQRTYQMDSQSWSPDHAVVPEKWLHTVDVIIPDDAIAGRALLVINNGTYAAPDQPERPPTDFSIASLRSIAQRTRTPVVSVGYIPNQPLVYLGDDKPKREDDSVALSWKWFLDRPQAQAFTPLQVPMMAAVLKAMDLAEKELSALQVKRFVVSGVSKRGWSAWHTALTDARVEAIVPFVIDTLNFPEMISHTYKTYGNNWPIALGSYAKEGIARRWHTENFERLMEVIDPWTYRQGPHASRLMIPKYIVNASGDDFFVSDNARFYFDALPGTKALRVAPNSSHYGIKEYTTPSLVSFVNRLQGAQKLPEVTSALTSEAGVDMVSVQFSELPIEVTQWTAMNPVARDFRYACGIRYVARSDASHIALQTKFSLAKPREGWTASFIEARFSDGFVATTRVYVSPDAAYPEQAPPSDTAACRTIPGL